MEQIVNLIVTNGMAVVIVAYFLFKDWKTTGQIINVLSEIREVLAVVRGGGLRSLCVRCSATWRRNQKSIRASGKT